MVFDGPECVAILRRAHGGPDPAGKRLSPGEVGELLAKYRRTAWWLARRIRERFPWVCLEDLASEVQLGFVQAAKRFDPSGPTGVDLFGLYVRRAGIRCGYDFCFRERFRGMSVRGNRAVRRGTPAPRVIALDDPVPGTGLTVAETIPARGSAADVLPDQDEWWAAAVSALTPRQRDVLTLRYRDGLAQRDVAVRLGLTQARVWRVIRAALKKLRSPPGKTGATVGDADGLAVFFPGRPPGRVADLVRLAWCWPDAEWCGPLTPPG